MYQTILRGFCLLMLLSITACARFTTPGTARLRQSPQVIGHAGSGFFTPINPFNPLPPSSLAGIRHALDRGADGVEIDIQLSRDSVPILFHDVDLTNRTAAQGYISQHTAAELTQLRYRGGWPYDWFQHERIATFDELLTELAQRPDFPYLHLDLHEDDWAAGAQPYVRSPVLVRALGRVLRQHRVPVARVLILTDYAPSLRQLRQELPGVELGLEINEEFDKNLAVARDLGVEAVVLSKYVITPERVAQAHTRGLQVVVFGGRSRKAIERLLRCRPDGIEVDNVPVLLSLLGRRGRAAESVPQAAAHAPNAGPMR